MLMLSYELQSGWGICGKKERRSDRFPQFVKLPILGLLKILTMQNSLKINILSELVKIGLPF